MVTGSVHSGAPVLRSGAASPPGHAPPEAGEGSAKKHRRVAPCLSATDPSEVVYLVGAGGSRRAGLPVVTELVEELLGQILIDRDVAVELAALCRPGNPSARHAFDYLRFETFLDAVRHFFDLELTLLQLFDLAREPSPLQQRLAEQALAGSRLMTTNFDDLLERAVLAAGGRPVTVDAHAAGARRASTGETDVLKLHGSLWSHRDGERRRSRGQLGATLRTIASRSPNMILRDRVVQQLSAAIDGATLVVVGYSALDDLDIVPALKLLRPRVVQWVSHSETWIGELPLGRVPGPASNRDLVLRALSDGGSEVHLVVGPTEEVLKRLGLGAMGTPPPTSLPWREFVESWASRHREAVGNGLQLASECFGRLERWSLAFDAASRSPAQRKGTWTAAGRAYALTEAAFLGELEDPPALLARARRGLRLARSAGDVERIVDAAEMLGRVQRWAGKSGSAIRTYREALGLANEGTLAWAGVAVRLANALEGEGEYAESLALLRRADPIFRRHGYVSDRVDAQQAAGMTYWALGRITEARRALGIAARLSTPHPTGQQHFAATGMLGGVERCGGDLPAARASLNQALEFAQRAPVWAYEHAIAYNFLGQVEQDAGAPDRSLACYRAALNVLRTARSRSRRGIPETFVITRCLIALAHLSLGRRSVPARIAKELGRLDPAGLGGEPIMKIHLVTFLLEPTASAARDVARDLDTLQHRMPSIYVDHCVYVAFYGRPDMAISNHITDAMASLRQWGDRARLAKVRAAIRKKR